MIKYSICIIKLSTHIHHKCDIAYSQSKLIPISHWPWVSTQGQTQGHQSLIEGYYRKILTIKNNKY